MTEQFIFAVTEASQVAEVRRQVVALASKLGFSETDVGKAAIVATEAATNLAKHAVQGEVVIRLLEDQDRSGIEILALDKGPGMVNVAQSLRDGYSTAGSPGTGMGAMRRLAGSFDLHSDPDEGNGSIGGSLVGPCALRESLRIRWTWEWFAGRSATKWSVETVGKQPVSRDVCCFWLWMAWATDSALPPQPRKPFEYSGPTLQHSPARIVEAAHAALRSTRGAVLGIAEIDLSQKLVRYAGVGNISGVIVSDGSSRHLVSTNGTVGHDVRKVQEFSYPFPDGCGARASLGRIDLSLESEQLTLGCFGSRPGSLPEFCTGTISEAATMLRSSRLEQLQ